ncbi:MAG: glycoside hydrolase family 172 protein [Bacteroidota bacterium]
MRRYLLTIFLSLLYFLQLFAQSSNYNGLNSHLGNLFRVSNAKTRSISPENFTGEKGKAGMSTLKEGTAREAARDLGQGWKVNPYINIKAGETFTLAEIEGSGAIQHIWMTPTGVLRFSILRIYWDDETEPSVECPVGDFFGTAKEVKYINSLAVCVNPGSGFNSFWQMPFRKKCKITLENIDEKGMRLYYQIDYTLTEVPEDAAYFHAQFRRTNPLPYKEVYTIVDDIKGKGHYVGTYMFWQPNNNGWWGEGEIKFYMDGDKEFPTICGTGTEDYFLGSYNFGAWDPNRSKPGIYKEYSTAYAGFQYFEPGQYKNIRFGLYRWHIVDPIRFGKDLKITIQALGWRSGGRYLPLQDDLSSVAFWYQLEPHAKFPSLPDKDYLEIE